MQTIHTILKKSLSIFGISMLERSYLCLHNAMSLFCCLSSIPLIISSKSTLVIGLMWRRDVVTYMAQIAHCEVYHRNAIFANFRQFIALNCALQTFNACLFCNNSVVIPLQTVLEYTNKRMSSIFNERI